MKFTVNITSREFEIVGDEFDTARYFAGGYDDSTHLGFDREAYTSIPDAGVVPVYMHDTGIFSAEAIAAQAQGFITGEPVFSIFNKKELTFAQMLAEIEERISELVTVIKGDDNPYA